MSEGYQVAEHTREYFRSLLSQRGIRQTFFTDDPRYNASWDYAVSPAGRHYVSICAEGPALDAMLYEYVPETAVLKKCLDMKTDMVSYPETLRPSKIHTCISFMEDGCLIMNNHTTAQSSLHPDWMPKAYYGHPWEGFPGSNLLIYDPATGKTEDLGIPVRGESLYGGAYDCKRSCYYCTGYFRGHGYRVDLSDRRVTDFGQVTEYSTYLHTLAPDGHIYFSSVSGELMRYNVDMQRPEELGLTTPIDPDFPESRSHNVMAYASIGPDGRLFYAAHRNEYLFALDMKGKKLEKLGHFAPAWYREKYRGTFMVFGMDFDSEGVLWYGLKLLGNCMRFVSWDVLRGCEPVDHGIFVTK